MTSQLHCVYLQHLRLLFGEGWRDGVHVALEHSLRHWQAAHDKLLGL
jgi:hypothetical protein